MQFDSIYVVLGLLDEYSGRFIEEDDDRVERFYREEKRVADVFKHYLLQAGRERGIEVDVETETGEEGQITYRSPQLAELINSRYRYELGPSGYLRERLDESGRTTGEYEPIIAAEAFVSPEMFASAAREQKLSFFAGVHTRYGEGIGQMRFANAEHKARLTKELLEDLGCRDVEHETTRGYVPNANVVRYVATEEVRGVLGEFEVVTNQRIEREK